MSAELLVDGNSIFARAFYATAKDFINGEIVLRSALQTVFSLLNRDVPRIGVRFDRTLFCWDGQHGRDKGNRQAKPREYDAIRDIFKELVVVLIGTNHATPPLHEADDAVATSVANTTAEDVYICSGDKDLTQLQAPHVHYYCLNTRAILSRSFITSKFSVKHPRQIAIAQAVLGDKVDNISGIKGWGPAKVKMLFQAVTPEMSFDEALAAIEKQIPDCHLDAFYSSLERTLLDPTLTGLPAPAPLKFISLDEVAECGVTGIESSYARMVESYGASAGPRRSIEMAMEEND